MSDKQKVLVCGDVNGKFKTLFMRVEAINKKSGPFDFLLCVGNFFGSSSKDWLPYREGVIKVPVPTYVLGPNSEQRRTFYPDINGGELAPNVSYLGKKGVFTSSTGLKLAYVGGVERGCDGGGSTASKDCSFTQDDVTRVRDASIRGQPSYRGVDILLTAQWPAGVTTLDSKLSTCAPSGSPLLAWLAVQLKPRYHFCALEGIYYERPPYRNLDTGCDSGAHCTRFMALASVGNTDKQKWLYALSLTPIDLMRPSELRLQTTDQTELPYRGAALSHSCLAPSAKDQPAQFFYDMDSGYGGGGRGESRKRGRGRGEGEHGEKRQRPTFDQETCWFCLASPQVEKHLVVSIGNEVYLAMAKGGLVEDHVLILPVGHHQSASDLPNAVRDEIEQFKTALKKCFSESGKSPVFYERNYKTSHLQIQVVPVPTTRTRELKEIFQEFAQGEGVSLDELPPHTKLDQIAPPGTPYFYVELPTGDKLYHRVRKSFPLQFGRDVLASDSVLTMADRADWRDCKLSKDEENNLAKKFRNIFHEFDFTLK